MNSGGGLVETWIPDGGFEIQTPASRSAQNRRWRDWGSRPTGRRRRCIPWRDYPAPDSANARGGAPSSAPKAAETGTPPAPWPVSEHMQQHQRETHPYSRPSGLRLSPVKDAPTKSGQACLEIHVLSSTIFASFLKSVEIRDNRAASHATSQERIRVLPTGCAKSSPENLDAACKIDAGSGAFLRYPQTRVVL